MKQLPLDRYFDINNVKGLRSLIKGVLELAKEPSRLCLEECMANDHFESTLGYGIKKEIQLGLAVIWFAIVWSIWEVRNATIFMEGSVNVNHMLELASYGAYAGYGGNYANSQLPTSVPQSTAYGAYPPA
ncbi:hypothetical protein RJT34_07890 [Clitoria ternatea]|uniref:Uncharacterized protein n=1 Tax=Clitoria ternatea TaxID=43366 RepID=A0AAN9PTS3_CLITE